MASEPYERPAPPSRARVINDRHVFADAPPEVGLGLHLTIVPEKGASYWGEAPVSGRSAYSPIELDYDNPDVMVTASDWTVGLTAEQVEVVARTGATPEQRVTLAMGFHQMNANDADALHGNVRRPHYVHPTDAANPDAAGLPIETVHEREHMDEAAKAKRRYLPVPPDAVGDTAPVAFIEVDDDALRRTRPVDVYKRGSSGRMTLHRGRPLPD